MTANQILILVIVILLSIIVVFGIYFLLAFLKSKKKEKKVETIFSPTNLVEEESLMNVMDDKKNVEFKKNENTERFVSPSNEVQMVTSNSMSQEQKVNPFGVDLTLRTKEDGQKIEIQDPNNTNKFIK